MDFLRVTRFNKDSKVKRGAQKVLTASLEMPGLLNLVQDYKSESPLDQTAILGCVTLTPQTAIFMFALRELGAELSWCSDNRFASDPEVIAYLQASDFTVFAKPNMSLKLYYDCMKLAYNQLATHPNVQIHDDGCDITRYLAENYPSFLKRVWGITEQTTCGTTFLTHLYRQKKILCPSIDVAHGYLKGFDNFYGIQQSLIQALTNIGITIASQKISLVGYGVVGEGAASALQNLGASVSIVEQDIVKLVKAHFNGLTPHSIEDAMSTSNMILSATGCLLTITGEMINNYAKDGLILGNIGHGQEEIDIEWLDRNCEKDDINEYRTVYILPDRRKIHLICEGALVNFIAGAGNPSRELSLTFTAAALAQIALVRTRQGKNPRMPSQICPLSPEIEDQCGKLNFPELVSQLYRLTPQQKEYLNLE